MFQFAPLLCFSFVSVRNIISLFWEVHAVRRGFNESYGQDLAGVFNKVSLTTVTIFGLHFLSDISNVTGNRILTVQVMLFVAFLVTVLYAFGSVRNQTDLGPSVLIISIQAVLLLKLSNLIALFFLLELMNSFILYTML